MTPIKRKLLYIFRGNLLRLRISWNHGESITLSVGYSIDRTDTNGKPKWDGSRCVRNTTHGQDKIPASKINKILEDLEEKINEAFYHFEVSDIIPSKSQLRETIKPKQNRSESFESAFTRFINDGETKYQWAYNTIKSVRQFLKLFLKYRSDITISDLNIELLEDFATWQQTHRLSPKQFKNESPGYSNIVIRKHNRIMKWFLKWAVKQKIIGYDIERSYTTAIKTIEKPVIFLTWEELMKMESLELETGSIIDKCRDFFCFCAFTSLRYSDAVSLKKSSIKDDSFMITTQKTGTKIIIDLNEHSKKIIDKYKDTESEYILPTFKVCTINQYIKKIGKMAGFTSPVIISQYYGSERKDIEYKKYELLSTHAARRTFISNALSMGISPNIVMKWTGHTEYSSMKPYIEIADRSREEEMKKFNKTDSK